MYNFEYILNRSHNGSKKWNKEYINKRFPGAKEQIFPFFIADMDYRLPEEIIDAFIAFIKDGDFGYFDILDDFKRSIIYWYGIIHSSSIEDEWIIPGIGTISSMKAVISALVNRGENILIFTPVYGPFREIIEKSNCSLSKYPLIINEKEYIIDFEQLEQRIVNDNVKSILFCSPHNPSGKVWSKSQLDRLIDLCKKYNLILFVDEVHSDLILGEKKYITMANYFDKYRNIVISTSPNKTFNLAGLNASYLLTPNKIFQNKIQEEFSNNKLTPNRVGSRFLTLCYEKGEEWVYALRNNIKENYELVRVYLSHCDMEIIEPEAGYLLWVKLNKVKDVDKFVLKLAQHTGVLLETGSRFIDNYDGFVRINLATSKKILREGINAFTKYYDDKLSV